MNNNVDLKKVKYFKNEEEDNPLVDFHTKVRAKTKHDLELANKMLNAEVRVGYILDKVAKDIRDEVERQTKSKRKI